MERTIFLPRSLKEEVCFGKMNKFTALSFPFKTWRIIPVSLALAFFSLFACTDIEEHPNNPHGNFEALWKIIDEHYCFFEYKEIDWNKIHSDYAAKIKNNMNSESLFLLLNEMLQELKDGHVNLYTPFDVGRYWKWYEDYPANFDESLVKNYLDSDYAIAGGIRYQILEDSVGYLYYGNFSAVVGETNLDYIINKMTPCKGMIIDVRNNGGGMLSNVDRLVSRFVNEKTLVGYILHKTGKAHNDFSKPVERYIEPSNRLHYKKKVIVLTNRSCFSATNDFVNAMRYCPNVRILGDKTGGGSGLPFSSELPNGWSVRFSAVPILDADKQQIEFGIDPDIHINLSPEDMAKKRDTLIEAARNILKNSPDKI